MTSNTLQYLFFSYYLGIGPITFDKLIAHFGSFNALYNARSGDLQGILRDSMIRELLQFRDRFDAEKEYKRLGKKGITVITREDAGYPPQFKHLHDQPICLFVKGDLSNYDYERDNYFAVVGTRTPTDYGRQVATKISSELSQAGFVIVSGLARGIDAIAHRATLSAGGRTIAFLGCGVNVVYPTSNTQLYHDILAGGGIIISESPPDMTVIKGLLSRVID